MIIQNHTQALFFLYYPEPYPLNKDQPSARRIGGEGGVGVPKGLVWEREAMLMVVLKLLCSSLKRPLRVPLSAPKSAFHFILSACLSSAIFEFYRYPRRRIDFVHGRSVWGDGDSNHPPVPSPSSLGDRLGLSLTFHYYNNSGGIILIKQKCDNDSKITFRRGCYGATP